jgi:hypothetical protein
MVVAAPRPAAESTRSKSGALSLRACSARSTTRSTFSLALPERWTPSNLLYLSRTTLAFRPPPGYGSGGWGFGSQPGPAPAPPGGTTTATTSQPTSTGPTRAEPNRADAAGLPSNKVTGSVRASRPRRPRRPAAEPASRLRWWVPGRSGGHLIWVGWLRPSRPRPGRAAPYFQPLPVCTYRSAACLVGPPVRRLV